MALESASMHGLDAWPDVVAGTMHMAAWGLDSAERLHWIETCVDLGIDAFDHADIYGSYTVEGLFGDALAMSPGLRHRIRLVTKCGIRLISPNRPAHRLKSYDASAAHLTASVDASLAALRTDRIDLLLLHRPDPLMHPDEVADAVRRLRADGKVLAFGVSNFSPSQFALLDAALPLATNQIELHPLHRDPLHDGTLDQALRLRRRPMIWSPLAGGRLLRPVADSASADARVKWVVGEISARLGVSPAAVLHAWCRRHPSRPIIVTGSRRAESLRDALPTSLPSLSREDWTAIWQAAAGHEPD
jgi:predicted oxidoreductase